MITATDDAAPLDLVIANAGISAGTGKRTETKEQNAAIFATNVQGVFNTLHPLHHAAHDGAGSRTDCDHGLTGWLSRDFGAPSYAASKAAVRLRRGSARRACKAFGVKINVICPGFVKTPMTEVNKFAMPFLMDAPRAARIIRRGLMANKARIAFPWPMAALVWLIAALPPHDRPSAGAFAT